jgi:hypothetical protein
MTYVVGLPPLNSVVKVLDNEVELIITYLVGFDVLSPLSGNPIKRSTCIVVVWKILVLNCCDVWGGKALYRGDF